MENETSKFIGVDKAEAQPRFEHFDPNKPEETEKQRDIKEKERMIEIWQNQRHQLELKRLELKQEIGNDELIDGIEAEVLSLTRKIDLFREDIAINKE